MGAESIEKFRERVNEDSALQPAFLEAFSQGPAALAALGKAQGFDFSEADASTAISEASHNGELSDFELEMVSGGVIRGSILNPGSGDGVTVNLDSGVSAGPVYSSPAPAPAPAQSSGGGGK